LKARSQSVYAGLAISLYAAWNARDLPLAWMHSPYDRMGWLAFLLWLQPLGCFWMCRQVLGAELFKQSGVALFALGLAVSFTGVVVDLNAVKYLGLALSLGGFLPPGPALWAWLGCAAGWMPVIGWTLSLHSTLMVNLIRVVSGLVALFLTPLFLRYESKS